MPTTPDSAVYPDYVALSTGGAATYSSKTGLTKRELFALEFTTALLEKYGISMPWHGSNVDHTKEKARLAVAQADALIAALNHKE